jgi:hypothetical protein
MFQLPGQQAERIDRQRPAELILAQPEQLHQLDRARGLSAAAELRVVALAQ